MANFATLIDTNDSSMVTEKTTYLWVVWVSVMYRGDLDIISLEMPEDNPPKYF